MKQKPNKSNLNQFDQTRVKNKVRLHNKILFSITFTLESITQPKHPKYDLKNIMLLF